MLERLREEIARAAFIEMFLSNAVDACDDYDAASIAWRKGRFEDDRKVAFAIADSVLRLPELPDTTALAEAEARGRRQGLEEAAKVEKRLELAEREIASLRESNRSLAALLWPDDDAEKTAATKGPLFVHDFAHPEVSSNPSPGDVTLSCDHPATITVAFMGNGMTGTLDEARANAAKIARLWNLDLAATPAETQKPEEAA